MEGGVGLGWIGFKKSKRLYVAAGWDEFLLLYSIQGGGEGGGGNVVCIRVSHATRDDVACGGETTADALNSPGHRWQTIRMFFFHSSIVTEKSNENGMRATPYGSIFDNEEEEEEQHEMISPSCPYPSALFPVLCCQKK